MSKAAPTQDVRVKTAETTGRFGHQRVDFTASFTSDDWATQILLFVGTGGALTGDVRVSADLTADAARELAAGLIRAADLLDAGQ